MLVSICAPGTLNAANIRLGGDDPSKQYIVIEGDIQNGDEEKFRRLAAQLRTDDVVFLDSNGGSTITAIRIGEAIRLKGLATFVINNKKCNSACALIWLAGSPRIISRSAYVGFHATYINTSSGAQESGAGNALVGRYLTLLNLPERAIYFATSASPNTLNYLGSQNYQRTGIETQLFDDVENEAVQATSKPAVKQGGSEVTPYSKIGRWNVIIDHTLGNGCFALTQWNDGTVFRFGYSPTYETKMYVFVANLAWKSIEIGKEYNLKIKFGSYTPWEGSATARKMGDIKVLYLGFNDPGFFKELSSADDMSLFYGNRLVNKLDLVDSSAAVSEVARCQSSQPAAKDPFESE